MSVPSTPLSISNSTVRPESTSSPFRPFSPSPPRDNIHTASRPASLFLGTAVPASPSLTNAQSFNTFGLPATPGRSKVPDYFGMPREMPEEMFTYGDREIRNRKTSRVGQPGEVDRTTATAELAITRDSLSMVRSMSNSSLSTTSSASPPLGSASILATLADADAPSIPFPRGRISGRSSGYSTPPARSPEGLSRNPQSASSIRTALSDVSSLSGSKSMPRLHQPTVVRSTSGKGVSFLPPPGRASATSSLGRTRTSRTSAAARFSLPANAVEDKVRDRKYHSMSGGESSRPRSISYLSDLGPPVQFPKSPTVASSAVGRQAEGDREAERMLKSRKIIIKGGGGSGVKQEPVIPYGIDADVKQEPKRRDVLSEKKKDLAQDRPIDQLFPKSQVTQKQIQPELEIVRDDTSDTLETPDNRSESDVCPREEKDYWEGEGESLSRIVSGRHPGASRSPTSRLSDYLASDASSYTGGRGVSLDDYQDPDKALEEPTENEQEGGGVAADADQGSIEPVGNEREAEEHSSPMTVTGPSTPHDLENKASEHAVTDEAAREEERTRGVQEEEQDVEAIGEAEPSKAEDTDSTLPQQATVSPKNPSPLLQNADITLPEPTSEELQSPSGHSTSTASRLNGSDEKDEIMDGPSSSREDENPEKSLDQIETEPTHAESSGHSRSVSDDFTLHEVTDDEDPSLALVRRSDQGNTSPEVYIPPYKVRHSAVHRPPRPISPSAPPIEDQKFAITLLAGVSRQSRTDPLSLTIPHVELYLAWNEPRSWLWLPARKYIPAIDLRLVKTGQEVVLRESGGGRHEVVEMRQGLVRGVVRGVVGRLPIVWRLANWV